MWPHTGSTEKRPVYGGAIPILTHNWKVLFVFFLLWWMQCAVARYKWYDFSIKCEQNWTRRVLTAIITVLMINRRENMSKLLSGNRLSPAASFFRWLRRKTAWWRGSTASQKITDSKCHILTVFFVCRRGCSHEYTESRGSLWYGRHSSACLPFYDPAWSKCPSTPCMTVCHKPLCREKERGSCTFSTERWKKGGSIYCLLSTGLRSISLYVNLESQHSKPWRTFEHCILYVAQPGKIRIWSYGFI